MANGFHNKILRVDLSTREISIDEPGESFFRTYFGGWGLIAYYLLAELEPAVDPLGPENLLIFAPGVVTGAPAGGSGRSAVGAKSPLTGGFGESDVGGFWGAELKRAGWDGIVISGRAEKPVYLWIADDHVEIRDADQLWGRKTTEVEGLLKQELDDERIRVAQCGLAGENLVRYACVVNDLTHFAGRTGMGAVMGSKQLKAVAVRGTTGVPIAASDKVRNVARSVPRAVKEQPRHQILNEHGTDGFLMGLDQLGGLPTRNFQEGGFEGAENITGETMTDTILAGRDTCYACPVHCKREVEVRGRYQVDPVYGGPEYETVASLGSGCGVDDLEAIAYGNQLCNAYGLDTISTGVSIAWAMECFERGLLSPEDTGGLELSFGDAEAMTTLVEQIARREGFGDLLAEGTVRAAEAVGRGTERYAMHVKGQEVPMHEPRVKFALNIGYATLPTGADHNHNIHDVAYAVEGPDMEDVRSLGILEPLLPDYLGPEKVRLAKAHIDWRIFYNCLGLCNFMPYSRAEIRDLVQGVTGWNTSVYELQKVGARALAMARVFNGREGFTASDDVPPWRFSTPLEGGTAKGAAIPEDEMETALALYYDMNDWDPETGVPRAAKLHELGIGWVAELLRGSETAR